MTAPPRSKVGLPSAEFAPHAYLMANDPGAFPVFWLDKQILSSKRRLPSSKHTAWLAREHQTSVPVPADRIPTSAVPVPADNTLGFHPQKAVPVLGPRDDELEQRSASVDGNTFFQEPQYNQNRRRQTADTTTNAATGISSSALKTHLHRGLLDLANSPKVSTTPPHDAAPAKASTYVSCSLQTNYSGPL